MTVNASITPKYELLALRIVQGMSIADAGAAVGYAPNSAYAIAASPHFRAYLDELRQQIREHAVANVAEMIAAEAGPSVKTLIELRDTSEEHAIRRGCANDLLDRHPATAKISRSETKAQVNISFGPEAMRYLDGVIRERPGQEVIDVESEPLALSPADEWTRPKTIDEVADAYDES